MKKPDSLKDWIVIKNTKNDSIVYYYGTYDEFLYEECDSYEKDNWIGVPFANWTSKNLMEIFTGELERKGRYGWNWIPKSMLENMKKVRLTEAEKFAVLMGVYMDWSGD